jgi:hypothetical protein
MATRRRARLRGAPLDRLADEELLDLRLCDLGLSIRGTVLEPRIERLYAELARRGLRFRPHCWLSSEWFSPGGVPGIAIPFFLAHPRLMRLERKQMLEVEGGTEEWCMKLLRHEAGHALDSAFRLHHRPSWRKVFGRFGDPYPDFYQPRPYSKAYVLHLDLWYAQSHPAEDFAETFAVWLTPGGAWRKRFKGWPARRKLEYVDELMAGIAGQAQPVRCREQTESLATLKTTLREFYERKRARYSDKVPDFYDRDLRRLFVQREEAGDRRMPAAVFLRRVRPEIRSRVARWTHEYQYTIDQVLGDMIERAVELELVVDGDPAALTLDATIVLTVQTMNFLHSGHHRLAR